MQSNISFHARKWLFISLGAFALLCYPIYNGFPILYNDSSTYLNSGFELITPADRPITYGIFIRLASLNGFSLWSVIFFQSLILSFLIFLLIKQLFGDKNHLLYGLLTIIFLSLFTGISWTSGQLIADIFTPIAFLTITVILIGNYKLSTTIFLYFLFFISSAMHLGHLVLFVGILYFIFKIKKYLLPKEAILAFKKRIFALILLCFATILIMGSALSKSRHVFMMAAMTEHGITKTFLDDNCQNNSYQLCLYKDSLPKTATAFMWDLNSPLYKMGGWKACKPEFNKIISNTLTSPKYLWLHIKESTKSTIDQLLKFGLGDGNGKFDENTTLYKRINMYFPSEMNQLIASKQYNLDLPILYYTNIISYIIEILSFLFLIFLFFVDKSLISGKFKLVFIFIMIGIVLNAWDCGTFSCSLDRYGIKMMWLSPFLAIIALISLIEKRRNINE